MTTSGTINSALTAGDMVRLAMEELAAISSGETPEPAETATGIERLNWMLKSWQAKGVNLWREETTAVTIPVASAYGALTPNIGAISGARLRLSGIDRPLQRFERGEYMSLPNKTAAGSPTSYYPEKRVGNTNLYVWPVPTTAATILIDYARIIEDVTAPEQTLDVPQEWTETVVYNLAARLANTFGAARLDQAAVQRVTAYAAALEQTLLDQDRPASVFFVPSNRYAAF